MLLTIDTTAVAAMRTAHGFDAPSPTNIDRKLLMAIGEIIEAQNELRKGMTIDTLYFSQSPTHDSPLPKPEGVGIEIMDAILRLVDIAHAHNIDLQRCYSLKMTYNASRSHHHGGKVF